MSIILDEIRPCVIEEQTKTLLNEFRAFRHVFRNVYGFNLVCERIDRLLVIFPETIASFKKHINEFIDKMDKIINDNN